MATLKQQLANELSINTICIQLRTEGENNRKHMKQNGKEQTFIKILQHANEVLPNNYSEKQPEKNLLDIL